MKVSAVVLVIMLGVFGWLLPAGAEKVRLTDQELDGVSAGDVSVAGAQSGLGSSSASAQNNGGPLNQTVSVANGISQIQSFSNGQGSCTIGCVSNGGTITTKQSSKAEIKAGKRQLGCRKNKCAMD